MSIVDTLIEAGLHLHTDGDRLVVAPAARLTEPLRDLIRQHKTELLAAAAAAERGTADLIAAINACCDLRGDDDHNRIGLIAECRLLPARAQADLREHFKQEADRWEVGSPAVKKIRP